MGGVGQKWAYLFGLGTLKPALSIKNELIKSGDLFHADTNLRKLKVTLIIGGWA